VRNLITTIESDPDYVKKGFDTILASLKESEKKLDNDAILAYSVGTSKKVVLPLFFVLGNPSGRVSQNLPDYLQNNSLAALSPDNSFTAREMLPPIPEFSTGALGLGHINIIADRDGTVRSEPLFINLKKNYSLPLPCSSL